MNGRSVARLSDLLGELEKAGVGQALVLEILRRGQTERLSVEVADLGPARR